MPARKPKTRTALVYTAQERGREVFSCPLQCERCIGQTVSGKRCGRRSCIGTPFCWTHAQQLLGVQVKSYPGMGKGLMAVRKGRAKAKAAGSAAAAREVVFQKGDFLMPYFGEVLSAEEYDRRYVQGTEDSLAEYVIEDGAGRFVDAACQRSLPGLANTIMTKAARTDPALAPLDGQPIKYISSVLTGTNTKFTVRTKAHDWHGIQIPAKSAWFVATKPIREGDQILAYYGKNYRVYITPGYQTTGTARKRVAVAPKKKAKASKSRSA
jgi:hypothetical protein